MRKRRFQEDYKRKEDEKNNTRIKKLRKENSYKQNESHMNKGRMIERRALDQEYKMQERSKNKMRMAYYRLDELLRFRESYARSINTKCMKQEANDHKMSLLISDFFEDRKQGPEYVCDCCNNLFFPRSMRNLNFRNLKQNHPTKDRKFDEFLSTLESNSGSTYDNNDEVLIIDRNKEMSDDILIVAPGQDKNPMPSHRIENFDELCFPRIFGGRQLDKLNQLTYSQRVKYEIRHRDRRSCNPTRLLFMAEKKLEMSVASCINTCLRKTLRCSKLKAKQVKDKSFIDHLIRQDEGYKFLRQIRSSPAHWDNVKKKHFCINQTIEVTTHLFHLFSY
ncbi:hypothetical protein QAD02_012613 [Eretmocerus hayati]|uniref:Uncharacterized protein n=1 Tax=Eretmocerus hayati TaxID=131215 RepID=A0ACC2P1X8_9HYME|nr:hypothetical protein QAD02_012613 [Eretmocerus hayati]